MINPNATSRMYGEVLELKRSRANGSLAVMVRLISGQVLHELGFIYHKSLKVGDKVVCDIGYSITSDRYGIRAIRRQRKDYRGPRVTGRFVQMVVDYAYKRGYRCEWSERRRCFIINGSDVLPKDAMAHMGYQAGE